MSEPKSQRAATLRVRGALSKGLRRLASFAGAKPVLDDLNLILTIPKTGTYTLLEIVQSLGLEADIRGANHQLCSHHPAESWEAELRSRSFVVNAAWERGRVNERWAVHQHLRRRAPMAGCIPPRKVHVISATREPVGQKLSGVFFNSAEDRRPMDIDSARAGIMDQKPLETGWLSNARWWEFDAWFDRNVKAILGIDVFAEPFDRERGWQIYEGEDARLLLIRQESFASLPEAVSRFYGVHAQSVVIPRANAGEGFAYRDTYRDAKQRMRLPPSILDTVYSARYARHFYSNAEIQTFRQRWAQQ